MKPLIEIIEYILYIYHQDVSCINFKNDIYIIFKECIR